MNRAIFLDRDGVINEDDRYVHRIEDFRFTDGVFDFCRFAQSKNYLLIVVTNQAGIARGYYTENDFVKLNDWMLERFAERGVSITKVYHCPYHPEHGVGRYKLDSPDRKPNPGMLFRARDDFDIDLSQSVLIGDKDSDLEAGHSAGVGTLVFLRGKYSCETNVPHVACGGFEEIANAISCPTSHAGGRHHPCKDKRQPV